MVHCINLTTGGHTHWMEDQRALPFVCSHWIDPMVVVKPILMESLMGSPHIDLLDCVI